jgi:hypothetical protein
MSAPFVDPYCSPHLVRSLTICSNGLFAPGGRTRATERADVG